MGTTKNFVLLAVMQVGVVVMGILAAGTTGKVLSSANAFPSEWTTRFVDFGILLLVLPPLWIWAVMKLHQSPNCSDRRRRLAFLSGVLLLGMLLYLNWVTSIRPFLQICGMHFGAE
jgi:CDP-diglyceride synthetase